MKKYKSIIFLFIATILFISGCGTKGKENRPFIENIPDPEEFFSDNCTVEYYYVNSKEIKIKGIDVIISNEDPEELFRNYILECQKDGTWTKPVFDGEISWCYQNEEETKQLAINLREGKIVISEKNLQEVNEND